MFTLNSLYLKNFGAVRESTFAPRKDALTSIYGANGNGKSSFLDAIVWALFGVLPKDRKQTEIRNFYADEKENTRVIVEFEHLGDTITVTRSMSAKGSVTAKVEMNGSESPITKVTPTTAVAWVKKRLGINEEGFTKAFAIRQKELDDLVTATASERRKIIERISGVDRLSKALKLAKEDEKRAKTVFEASPNPQSEIDATKETLDEAEQKFSGIEANMESISVDAEFAKKQKELAHDKWQEELAHRQVYLDIVNKTQNIDHQISLAESHIENLNVRVKEKQSDIEGDEETVRKDFDESAQKAPVIREEINSIRERISSFETQLNQYKNKVESASQEVERKSDELDNRTAQLEEAKTLLSGFKKAPHSKSSITKKRKEHQSAKEIASTNLALAQNLKKSLEKNIDLLSDHTEEAHCPTCKQGLSDVSGLLSEFKADLEGALKQIETSEEEIVQAQKGLNEVEEQEQANKEWEKNKDQAQQGLDNAQYFVEKAEAEKKDAESQKEQVEKSLDTDSIETSILEAKSELEKKQNELEELLEHGRKLKTFLDSWESVEQLKNELEASNDRLVILQEEKEAIVPVGEVSAETVETAKNEYDKAVQAFENVSSSYSSMEQDYYMLKSDIAVHRERLDSLNLKMESYSKAKFDYEKTAATSLLMTEFRKNTISRIAPEIAYSATNVVSSMTSDEFTSIEMDDEFTPTITRANGRKDTMNLLSGGEKSLVALAIYIGIGDLISGGTGGLLWMDEALVSQDANRRNLIVTTLRGLDNRQIVMVNHTPDGNDLSDVVVELVKGEKGSYLRDD